MISSLDHLECLHTFISIKKINFLQFCPTILTQKIAFHRFQFFSFPKFLTPGFNYRLLLPAKVTNVQSLAVNNFFGDKILYRKGKRTRKCSVYCTVNLRMNIRKSARRGIRKSANRVRLILVATLVGGRPVHLQLSFISTIR